jgi:hypothetical protein
MSFYDKKHLLQPDEIYEDIYGDVVMLVKRVPGDGSAWYVADWDGKSWGYYDTVVEPSDLAKKIRR